MQFKKLDELEGLGRKRNARRLAVAAAGDRQVLIAVRNAADNGLVQPVLIGNVEIISRLCRDIGYTPDPEIMIDEPDPEASCIRAVKLIREGKADILMKGMVSTAGLLKAVLDKEYGLRKRELISHFSLIEVPSTGKLIGITDAAMNIAPTLGEKACIISNAVEVYHRLGFKEPKVAALAPVETVNPRIGSTLDAAALQAMNRRKQIEGCVVDGPLALDNAISAEAARHKGIGGPVAGKADILLAPDLNSGNILYKSLVYLSGGTAAAVIMGASVPIVLTSRADSEKNKYMSIALAAAMAD